MQNEIGLDSAVNVPPMPKAARPRASAVVRKQSAKKTGPLLMVSGLVIALLAVLVMPLLAGGAAVAPEAVSSPQVSAATFMSLEEAQQKLAFTPAIPVAVLEGYRLSQLNVLDGTILEMVYTDGKNQLVYRTAQGKEDLSGNFKDYLYEGSETSADGVVRGYSGITAEKLNLAVWSDGQYSYSVQSKDALNANEMKDFAGSIG